MRNQRLQLDFRTLPRNQTMINLLFLAPELLELLLLEIVEFSLSSFLDGLFGLSLPFRSVSARLEIGLEIAQCRAPVVVVAQKVFG